MGGEADHLNCVIPALQEPFQAGKNKASGQVGKPKAAGNVSGYMNEGYVIISGTNRNGSKTLRVANQYQQLL